MRIYTVFDDNFLEMAQSFINSERFYSDVPICAYLPESASRSIRYCKQNNIEHFTEIYPKRSAKQISRLLKMNCVGLHSDDKPIAYMDIDIVFQNDISQLENLNPNFLWVLSKREGHQTTLRTWKKHYFTQKTVEFAREHLPKLSDLPVEELLESPVRNCGVIYGNRSIVQQLMHLAKGYYIKLLKINHKNKLFSDSDQLCFLLAFFSLRDKIKELPLKFNRMPYHQSYDFKDKSCLLAPDNIVLHLNRCKRLGNGLVKSWTKNKCPVIVAEPNTRSGIVIPMQTSNGAERALTKNLYALATSNRANIYRDEDVGFPIVKRIAELDVIRNATTHERPAFDKGLFFMVDNFLFMIDHGEHVGNRAAWIIGKHVDSNQLAGIFIEQMDKSLDVKSSKIPILPLAYGVKQASMWLNQGVYHDLGLYGPKEYSVHFIGNFGTNKKRQREAKIIEKIPESKILHAGKSQRLTFDEYMRDMAMARIVWNPPGGRPKTHREIEAMCCEIPIVMPEQNIIEQENLIPDEHYICIKNDYSDAQTKIQHYLSHPDELTRIALNGRMWYERNASDYARAKYIHEQCLKIIASIK